MDSRFWQSDSADHRGFKPNRAGGREDGAGYSAGGLDYRNGSGYSSGHGTRDDGGGDGSGDGSGFGCTSGSGYSRGYGINDVADAGGYILDEDHIQ